MAEHPQWSLLESFGNADYSPLREVGPMAKYVPSPRDWVREQVELYESSGGTEGTTLRDTGVGDYRDPHRE